MTTADEDHVIGLKAPDKVNKCTFSTAPSFPPQQPEPKVSSGVSTFPA